MGEEASDALCAYVQRRLTLWRGPERRGVSELAHEIETDEEFSSLGVCGAFHGPTPKEFRALISPVVELSESERTLISEALALACFHRRAHDDPVMKVLRWVTQPLREGRGDSGR